MVLGSLRENVPTSHLKGYVVQCDSSGAQVNFGEMFTCKLIPFRKVSVVSLTQSNLINVFMSVLRTFCKEGFK